MNPNRAAKPHLPPELLARANTLKPEPFWPVEVAREVIEWFRNNGIAVYGVELFRDDGHSLAIIASTATSDEYRCDPNLERSEYIECSAEAALAFVRRFEHTPRALCTFSWSKLELDSE
jgi:hypothetical protein